jgi:hypothetical protein
MDFLDTMATYFRGERIEALACIAPVGLLCVVFGALILRDERSPFTLGVGVPFLVLGAALLAVGASVGFRTPGQVERLTALYRDDLARFVAEEIPRMRKVNANWPVYLATWSVFAIGGLVLRFLVQRDWARGVGIALVFFGGVGLLIDGFAERRARPYTEALEALEKERR